jgi:hypothetical protein
VLNLFLKVAKLRLVRRQEMRFVFVGTEEGGQLPYHFAPALFSDIACHRDRAWS